MPVCRSHEQGALEDTRSTEVTEPALVVEVLDEAVATEELDGVRADRGGMSRGEGADLTHELDRVEAGVEPGGCLEGREAQAVELDGDVGDEKRDRLSLTDGLSEGLAL